MQPKRVLAYARVSSEAQAERESLENQQAEFRRFCEASGYPEPIVFVEVESGGLAGEERRVEQARLLRDVRAGDLVLVAKQDRWSRAVRHFLASVDDILAKGARFYSIEERFNAGTPDGRLFATQLASFAEFELARIKERMVGTRKRMRARGAWVEGLPPLGYAVDATTRKLAVIEPSAEVVREMFRLAASGVSAHAVSQALRERWPDVPGLDRSCVARRLRSRVYLGEVHTKGGKADGEWIAAHEPLVDALTWRRAQNALDANRIGGRPLDRAPRCAEFLLRGLTVCGSCGLHMSALSPTPSHGVRHGGWYCCMSRAGKRSCASRARARHKDLDAHVEAEVLARLEEHAQSLAEPAAAPPVRSVVDLDAQRARLLAKRERLVAAVSEGALKPSEARAQLDKLAEQVIALDERRAVAERPAPTAADRRRQLADVRRLLRAWSRMSIDDRREAIATVVARVVVHRQPKAQAYARGAWTCEVIWLAPADGLE